MFNWKRKLFSYIHRDLPPRSEPELDPVTLHNLALTDTSGGIGTSLRRLAFLLEIG